MGDVVYTSKVKVVRHKGPVREAYLPARKGAVTFGVHSEVAKHDGVDPGDSPPDATTSTKLSPRQVGDRRGPSGAPLEARKIDASGGRRNN